MDFLFYLVLIVLIVFIVLYRNKDKDYKLYHDLFSETNKEHNILKNKHREASRLITQKDENINELLNILKTQSPFASVSSMVTDIILLVFEKEQRYLTHKSNPAPKAAERIKQLEKESAACISALIEAKYTLEYMEAEFPYLTKCLKKDLNNGIYIKQGEETKRLEKQIEEQEKEICDLEGEITERDVKIQRLINLIKSEDAYKYMQSMMTEAVTLIFENEQKYLRTKPNPALKSAERVGELEQQFLELMGKHLEMKNKFEYLQELFPELKMYIEDESFRDAEKFIDSEDVEDAIDHSRDYLSKEEWDNLSVNERNQLALDRYKEKRHRKNNWIAGVEYEMYCSYKLRDNGYDVIEFGAENKLGDLGRDIIAYKDGKTYIIQCKRFSQEKEIHENTICQLYGTTIHYRIKYHTNDLFSNPHNIIPVLVTTTQISETAKEFAKVLNIKCYPMVQMGEYPMIKCNINNGDKIYHLPFDQQYWRTKIDISKGESYEWTVEDAVNKEFRRAQRHFFN
jgi:hypothetical protein